MHPRMKSASIMIFNQPREFGNSEFSVMPKPQKPIKVDFALEAMVEIKTADGREMTAKTDESLYQSSLVHSHPTIHPLLPSHHPSEGSEASTPK